MHASPIDRTGVDEIAIAFPSRLSRRRERHSEGRLSFEGNFFDSYDRPKPCLNLPKLECLTLVTDTRSSCETASRDGGLSLRPKRRRVGSDVHSLLGSSFL